MCASSTQTERVDEYRRREEPSLRARIAANPRPAAMWAGVAVALVTLEFGAFVGGVLEITRAGVVGVTALVEVLVGFVLPGVAESIVGVQQTAAGALDGYIATAAEWPTLLSRETIPNQGHKTGPNGPWEGTFLGLSPAAAWGVRVALILAYSVFAFYWLFRGWMVYRDNYRRARWTPMDDIVNRLRGHRWGEFGLLVLVLFLTMAVFGPALGPSTVEDNITSPYSHEFEYYNEEAGEVQTVTAGQANFESKSKGAGDANVGVMQYDDFGRFHPFGTLTNGRDLFTFMMAGARISLIVAGLSIGLSAFVAGAMSMVAAFYSGLVDLTTLTVADGIVSVPRLLMLILVSVLFQGHWLSKILDGGFLLALVFAFTGWPFLWRAVRPAALQVAEEEWIDAAKSFGQRPHRIMRKHMFPYIFGYLVVYSSMSIGGIIIGLASLSFLGNGLGINPPTPAWGRAVSLGQQYVSTQSWHISLIPGIMIVILVTGANALGDGLRDAIDPESEGESETEAGAGGAAG